MSNSNNFHVIPGRIQIKTKPKLQKLIESYSIYEFLKEFKISTIQILLQNIKKSEIAFISKYQIKKGNIFLIIIFYNTVIVIKNTLVHLLAPLFCHKPELKIYFLEDTKDIFNQEMQNANCSFEIQIECDKSMDEEIKNFDSQIYKFEIKCILYKEMRPIIQSSIMRYLIQESYNKLNEEQIVDFSKDFVIKPPKEKKMNIEKWDLDEYIELKNIGSGSSSEVKLMYQIENKRLYAIKMQNNIKYESEEYKTREYKNYLQLDYPLFPKLYGIYEFEDKYFLKIQFINGKTLDELVKLGLTDDNKIFIIIQLILIINYLHKKGFVYRDLKPNNIIVDENNTVFIIDFDRMISEKTYNMNRQEHTNDFITSYMAPEVNNGQITPKNDIYSLGKIIEYISNNDQLYHNFKIYADENPNNRPSIFNMLNEFISFFPQKIDTLPIKYTPEIQYFQGFIHINDDIIKSIQYLTLAANQNHPQAQYALGLIYDEGQYITRDINKSIYYYTLAANQNHPQAQYALGLIYDEGLYITQDIKKSIYYYTLAANQNHLQAQFNLGLIYEEGEYIKRDINKSIHYYTLAANQNDPQAQYNLGLIYCKGQYITRNIKKSIQYLTLAANQNIPEAQFVLGAIYYEGQYVTRDINKSIHYYTLAANQNYLQAQFNLGFIYSEGQYITLDINKSIHYFTLAANQNYPQAQYNLGSIYFKGQYITRNIKKSIQYLTLAANQNIPEAQFVLGAIYYEGQYITRDINKSIHYYTLAANQNYPQAQLALGTLNLIENNTNRGLNLLDKSSSAGNIDANFVIGYLYHEGKYLDRNMSKSIKHYKYASSFNNIYSKNNLGVIYKNGICEIPKNIGYAIEYFEETVRRWEDKLSMYNLAHIYIYEIKTAKKIDESIELLIKSSNLNFEPSKYLLCIALLRKHNFDFEKIQNELTEKLNNLVKPVINIILNLNLLEKSFFQIFEKEFETIDYLYDFLYRHVQSKHILNQKNEKNNGKLKNITQEFYDGFGYDI